MSHRGLAGVFRGVAPGNLAGHEDHLSGGQAGLHEIARVLRTYIRAPSLQVSAFDPDGRVAGEVLRVRN